MTRGALAQHTIILAAAHTSSIAWAATNYEHVYYRFGVCVGVRVQIQPKLIRLAVKKQINLHEVARRANRMSAPSVLYARPLDDTFRGQFTFRGRSRCSAPVVASSGGKYMARWVRSGEDAVDFGIEHTCWCASNGLVFKYQQTILICTSQCDRANADTTYVLNY